MGSIPIDGSKNMKRSARIVMDLTTFAEELELSSLISDEWRPLLESERHIRAQTERLGIPPTPAQLKHYLCVEGKTQRNTGILIKLLDQAPYHKR